MAITQSQLDAVEARLSVLRGAVSRKTVADAGSYRYISPMTGEEKTAAIPQPEKDSARTGYESALADFKKSVDALS